MEIIIKPDERRQAELTFEDVRHFVRHSLEIEEQPSHIERSPQGEFYVTFNADRLFSDGGVFDHNDLIEVPASLELPSQHN